MQKAIPESIWKSYESGPDDQKTVLGSGLHLSAFTVYPVSEIPRTTRARCSIRNWGTRRYKVFGASDG